MIINGTGDDGELDVYMGRMKSILVVPRIVSEQSFGQQGCKNSLSNNIIHFEAKILGEHVLWQKLSNDVFKEGRESKENSVLRPTKVAANKVVKFEIVRSVKSSQQSDCLPADIDMRPALRLSKAPFRPSAWP